MTQTTVKTEYETEMFNERMTQKMKFITMAYKSGSYLDAFKSIEIYFPEKVEEFKKRIHEEYGNIGLANLTKYSDGKSYVYNVCNGSNGRKKPPALQSVTIKELYNKIKPIPDMRVGAQEGEYYEGFEGLGLLPIPSQAHVIPIPHEYIISLVKEVKSLRGEINALKSQK